ncbi:MAG: cyclic nucleotide-binding domain-containing protein [Magnetococcales bacterium]|nr:cyclic nucleotide-binding domain-containing protein [Magnetococcales bacterium]
MFDIGEVQEIRLFRGLDPFQMAALLDGCARKVRYLAGEEIFAEGSLGTEVYLLPRGRVKILLDQGGADQQEILVRGPEVFGEMAFLDQSPRSAAAIAADDLEVYVLDREPAQAFMTARPEIGLTVMRNLTAILARKLRQTNAILLQEVRRLHHRPPTPTQPLPEAGLEDSIDTFVRRRNSQRMVRSIVP